MAKKSKQNTYNGKPGLSSLAILATTICRIRHRAILLVFAGLLSVVGATAVYGRTSTSSDDSTTSVETGTESGYTAAETGFLSRSTLTSDWWGARSTMADNGVSLDFRYTSFYQGLVSGGLISGTGRKNFNYGGKVDAFINLDSGKMGLWEGGGFRSHIEYSHGDLKTNLGGTIFATNTAKYWPVATPDKVVATSLHFTQKVGDRSSIALGKFNPIDLLAADPFFGGWGIDRFMNLTLTAPPSGLIPVVFIGGIASIRTESLDWTIMVFDPHDRTNDYLPGDLFEDGVNISVGATHKTSLAGRKTSYGLTGLYSTAHGVDFSAIGGIGEGVSTKTGAWNINFEFKHNLEESRGQPNENWGFHFKVAIADGNPNYVKSSLVAGIGGKALFFGRPQDSFGLGVFYYNLSNVLEASVRPIAKIGDEAGIEAYYSWAVTPWLYFGPDIQYLNPARGRFKNALVVGLRMQIRI